MAASRGAYARYVLHQPRCACGSSCPCGGVRRLPNPPRAHAIATQPRSECTAYTVSNVESRYGHLHIQVAPRFNGSTMQIANKYMQPYLPCLQWCEDNITSQANLHETLQSIESVNRSAPVQAPRAMVVHVLSVRALACAGDHREGCYPQLDPSTVIAGAADTFR